MDFGVVQAAVGICHSQSCVEARGGQAGGNVLDFVAVMEHGSKPTALRAVGQDWPPHNRVFITFGGPEAIRAGPRPAAASKAARRAKLAYRYGCVNSRA